MIYLATPYSHPDPAVRQSRYEAVNREAARLMAAGKHVFSPISHTHTIALAGDLPLGWDYWQSFDRTMLAICSEMIVLAIDGWRQSKGVQAEMELARELGIPISLCEVTP